jgi:hypothetical protein
MTSRTSSSYVSAFKSACSFFSSHSHPPPNTHVRSCIHTCIAHECMM